MTASIATASNSLAAGPLLAAFATDAFADDGLEMEEVPFSGSSTNVVAAVLAGETDFGFLGATAAVNAGAELVIVGRQTFGLQTLVLRTDVIEEHGIAPDAPIEERVEALRGLTIATSPPGSANNAFLVGILERFGLDPEADLQVIPSELSAIVAGLQSGLYDGGFWSTGVLEPTIADGTAQQWLSLPQGDVEDYDQFFQAIVVAAEDTVANNPELADRFVASISAAGTAIEEMPDETREAVQARYFEEFEDDVFRLAWEATVPPCQGPMKTSSTQRCKAHSEYLWPRRAFDPDARRRKETP